MPVWLSNPTGPIDSFDKQYLLNVLLYPFNLKICDLCPLNILLISLRTISSTLIRSVYNLPFSSTTALMLDYCLFTFLLNMIFTSFSDHTAYLPVCLLLFCAFPGSPAAPVLTKTPNFPCCYPSQF